MNDIGMIIYFNLPPIVFTVFVFYSFVKYTYDNGRKGVKDND